MAGPSRNLQTLKPFPFHLYEGINLNWLVLYSVGVLEERRIDLSFDHIVIAAFKLFPKKFSLLTYPEHPDAKRVHDALWRCSYKNRQWLRGKTSQGFALTERGRHELDSARRALKTKSAPQKKAFSHTRRFEKLLAEVRTSPAFVKYCKTEVDKISEAECCHVLQGTLDSDRRVLVDNMTKLKDMAVVLDQKDISGFMDWLGSRFAHFLEMGECHGKV